MARPLHFESSRKDGIWTHVYVAEADGLFERRWGGVADCWTDPGVTPWSAYAVNPTWREDAAVYLALIWRLAAGHMLYGLPRFYPEAGMRANGAPHALVDWEYEVKSNVGDAGSIVGFVPARSSRGPGDHGTPWGREHANQAGLFALPTFGRLRDTLRLLFRDQTSELNVFAPGSELSSERLVTVLRQSARPSVEELVTPGDVCIDVVLANEFGYRDVITIQAADDLGETLFAHVGQLQSAIESFEARVETVSNGDDFVKAIAELVGLPGG